MLMKPVKKSKKLKLLGYIDIKKVLIYKFANQI